MNESKPSRRTPSRQTTCTFGDLIMRWFSLAVMFLLTAIAVRYADSANASDKDEKEPQKVDEKGDKGSYLLVVPPTGGKEVKLADWRFILGARQFSTTSEPPVKPKSKAPSGPEYLEFREEKSTTYQHGILTLVPLTSIRKIDYDREKKTVAMVVVKAGDKDETLTGTTKFVGINKITIEADAVLDGLGAATVKFQGGVEKGLQRVTFPTPKAAPEPKGTAANIIATDKEKTKHTAHDLQPLYLIDGSYRVLPYLMFKKTVKIDMDKVVSLRFSPSENKKVISYDFEVALKDGSKHTLTILTKIDLDKSKSATFEGLLGRVPVGYKLFPAHTIQDLQIVIEDEKK
jgi:hypothetical protein